MRAYYNKITKKTIGRLLFGAFIGMLFQLDPMLRLKVGLSRNFKLGWD
jgi:hypothetical protein